MVKVFKVKIEDLEMKSINNKYMKSIAVYFGGRHANTINQEINTEAELMNLARRYKEKLDAR